jgi:3-oxoacyl-[acyl-carrier protein] reductase
VTTPALDGKRILVTGATGAIGRSVCLRLSRAGAQLAMVGRRADALERLCDTLGPGNHRRVLLDVRDETAWRRAAGSILADGATLHGVVAAAATVTPIGPVGSWSVADARATVDTNVFGVLLAVVSFLEALEAGHGSVVVLSGGGATAPMPRYDAYAASKAAVVRLCENLSADLHERGVRLNAVAPGFVMSDMHQRTLEAGPELAGAAYYGRTAAAVEGHGADPPELAAELIEYLLCDEARLISGKLISARWDPWKDAGFRAKLAADPDFATLRRIDDQFFEARDRSGEP